MSIILSLILFLLLFIIIPAILLFRLLGINTGEDIFVKISLTLSVGFVLLTLLGLIIRFSAFGFWVIWILPVISVFYLLLNLRKIKTVLGDCFKNKISLMGKIGITVVILSGVIAQNLVLFRGGFPISEGLVFPSAHDTMWNIALTNELYHHFPPQHPGLAGELLKNNHYFYPLFLAIVRYVTEIDIFHLYFRFGPVLVSVIFGLSLYTISTIFTKSIFFRGLTVFLGYFSGNIAYILPLFWGAEIDWKGSTFLSDQPFDQIINPYSVLGFGMMLLSVYFLYQSAGKNSKVGWAFIFSFFAGLLYGFKSFGGIITASSIGLTMLLSVIRYQTLRLFLPSFLTLVVFLPVFFLITDPNKSYLHWSPGWLLTEMMSGGDKLNQPSFAQIENYYKTINNIPGLVKIKIIEFVIYFIGNLGIRIVGLVYLLRLIVRTAAKKNIQTQITNYYIFFVFLTAFLIPLLFNLGRNAYNIVQFTPYALVLSAVMTPLAAEQIYRYFYMRKKRISAWIVILAVVILAIPVNVKNIISKIEMPKDLIVKSELEAMKFIKEKSGTDDVILINPNQFNLDPIYFSALSERRVYIASPGYAAQTGLDYRKRLDNLNIFFLDYSDKDFLDQNTISYIYLLKKNDTDMIKKKLHDKLAIDVFFENDRVIIFKV